MSHQDYISNLSIDQLVCLIEMSQDKIKAAKEQKKVECFVVSDDWMNYGYYRINEPDVALKMFTKEFTRQIADGSFAGLSLNTEKFYPDEMKELFE